MSKRKKSQPTDTVSSDTKRRSTKKPRAARHGTTLREALEQSKRQGGSETLETAVRTVQQRLAAEDRTDEVVRQSFELESGTSKSSIDAVTESLLQSPLALRTPLDRAVAQIDALRIPFGITVEAAAHRARPLLEIIREEADHKRRQVEERSSLVPLSGVSQAPEDRLSALHMNARRGQSASERPVEFSAVERAITLLLQDGRSPRSTRKYATAVDVAPSTLSRNSRWRQVLAAVKANQGKGPGEFPNGSKDNEGNLQAWSRELCENCRKETPTTSVEVKGAHVWVCDQCAMDLGDTTTPRKTSRNT